MEVFAVTTMDSSGTDSEALKVCFQTSNYQNTQFLLNVTHVCVGAHVRVHVYVCVRVCVCMCVCVWQLYFYSKYLTLIFILEGEVNWISFCRKFREREEAGEGGENEKGKGGGEGGGGEGGGGEGGGGVGGGEGGGGEGGGGGGGGGGGEGGGGGGDGGLGCAASPRASAGGLWLLDTSLRQIAAGKELFAEDGARKRLRQQPKG